MQHDEVNYRPLDFLIIVVADAVLSKKLQEANANYYGKLVGRSVLPLIVWDNVGV